jgi:hypothetical protein
MQEYVSKYVTQKTLKKFYEKINNFSDQIPDILDLIRPCPNKMESDLFHPILIVFFFAHY